jgi:hypothetical protein
MRRYERLFSAASGLGCRKTLKSNAARGGAGGR